LRFLRSRTHCETEKARDHQPQRRGDGQRWSRLGSVANMAGRHARSCSMAKLRCPTQFRQFLPLALRQLKHLIDDQLKPIRAPLQCVTEHPLVPLSSGRSGRYSTSWRSVHDYTPDARQDPPKSTALRWPARPRGGRPAQPSSRLRCFARAPQLARGNSL